MITAMFEQSFPVMGLAPEEITSRVKDNLPDTMRYIAFEEFCLDDITGDDEFIAEYAMDNDGNPRVYFVRYHDIGLHIEVSKQLYGCGFLMIAKK